MSGNLVDLPSNFRPRVAHLAMLMFLSFTSGVICRDAAAQSPGTKGSNNAVQGFSQNRDQPIRIEASSLEMRHKKGEATFSGKVKVLQGDTTMTSKTMVVFYDSSPSPANAKSAPLQSVTPGPDGSSSIRRMEARGNVVVVQKDQIVTGETAIFDTRANLITVAGGVVLSQCKSVLRGSRLLVDMSTGVSRVESDTGAVHVLVDQSSNKDCGPQASPPAASAPRPKK